MPASPILRRFARTARVRGVVPVAVDCASWAARWATGRTLGQRADRPTFRHDGRDHEYLHHRYNYTWLNERAVEVPLAAAVLREAGPQARVLEVGNVLGHYQPVAHAVVDKYEQAAGVHNVDVVDIDLAGPFDLVLAISTLEHVGLDEEVQDPGKPARAIAHLASLLAPGGRLWCSVPLGYNPALDALLRDGHSGFTRLTALRRIRRDNRWEEIGIDEAWAIPYDRMLYTAHAVVVAELVRPAN